MQNRKEYKGWHIKPHRSVTAKPTELKDLLHPWRIFATFKPETFCRTKEEAIRESKKHFEQERKHLTWAIDFSERNPSTGATYFDNRNALKRRLKVVEAALAMLADN